MLEYFTLILACQLVGELVTTALDLPLPGPVVGMIMLFLFLTFRGTVPDSLATVSEALLNNLSLLFVPAGVGVMVHFELLGADVWPLSLALIASTLLTIAVTAIMMMLLNKHTARKATSKQGKT